jgi:hypothetical protein
MTKNLNIQKFYRFLSLVKIIFVFLTLLFIVFTSASTVYAGVMDAGCGPSGCGGGAGTPTDPGEEEDPNDPAVDPNNYCTTGYCTTLADGTIVNTGTIITYDVGGYDYCYVAGGGDCGSTGSTGDEVEVTAGCDVTAASNVSLSPYNSVVTDLLATWTLGSNVGYQEFYLSSDINDVNNNCAPAGSCEISYTIPANLNQITAQGVISPPTVYTGKIRSIKYTGCEASTSFNYLASCSLPPSNSTVVMNANPVTLTSQITDTATARSIVSRVTYSAEADPDGSATLLSSGGDNDNTPPYEVQVTGTSLGRVRVDSRVRGAANSVLCRSSAYVTVVRQAPWWQVRDSDVQTNASIGSLVPLGEYFGLPGNGTWPGIPIYGQGASFGDGAASSTQWTANSISSTQRVYNYEYITSQIPASIESLIVPVTIQGDLIGATPDEDGYEWYKLTGNGSINMDINTPLSVGARKVVLIVENADLNINADISVGSGLFLAIVQNDINVSPSVTSIEGLYVSDGSFSTGTLGLDINEQGQDDQLFVRGSIASYTGINLQRDLPDNSAGPAELFEYAPDQILLFPSSIGVRKLNWKEVAP